MCWWTDGGARIFFDSIIKHRSFVGDMRLLKQQLKFLTNFNTIVFNNSIFQDLLKAAIPELNGSIAKGEKFAADF